MAKINLAEIKVEKKGQVPPQFRDRVKLRVKDAVFGVAKQSGRDMITLTCEIVEPEKYLCPLDGQTYILDQFELVYYLSVEGENKEKTDFHLGRLRDFHEKLGLPLDFDPETDVKLYRNVLFSTILTAFQDNPTKKDEEGKYVPITDDDGKPIQGKWKFNTSIDNVLCATTTKRELKPF